MSEMASGLVGGRDLGGLLKGLTGLLPGLDAAKLLQQQQQPQNTASDNQAKGKLN